MLSNNSIENRPSARSRFLYLMLAIHPVEAIPLANRRMVEDACAVSPKMLDCTLHVWADSTVPFYVQLGTQWMQLKGNSCCIPSWVSFPGFVTT